MRGDAFVRKTPFAKTEDDAIRSVRYIDTIFTVEVIAIAACDQCATGIDSVVARFVGVA